MCWWWCWCIDELMTLCWCIDAEVLMTVLLMFWCLLYVGVLMCWRVGTSVEKINQLLTTIFPLRIEIGCCVLNFKYWILPGMKLPAFVWWANCWPYNEHVVKTSKAFCLMLAPQIAISILKCTGIRALHKISILFSLCLPEIRPLGVWDKSEILEKVAWLGNVSKTSTYQQHINTMPSTQSSTHLDEKTK